MERKIELSIICPMYNESNNIDYFFKRLFPVLEKLNCTYEIICINDGSMDETLDKILRYRKLNQDIKVINLSRNFGKEIALTAGLRFSKGKAVIPIDSDLQDPPEFIENLVKKWHEGYDVVYASRKKRYGETIAKRITAKLFYNIINYFSETPIPKNTGDFRLLDRKVVEVLNNIPERTRFMKGLFAWVGFNQVGISYDRDPRYKGKTKWNFWKLWNYALDGFTLFSTSALKIWSYLGIFISLVAFFYGSFLIFYTLFLGKDVPGYASIMVSVLFLGGLQLFSLGILGEYIGRIYVEVKRRPLYIVKDIHGFENEEANSYGKNHIS